MDELQVRKIVLEELDKQQNPKKYLCINFEKYIIDKLNTLWIKDFYVKAFIWDKYKCYIDCICYIICQDEDVTNLIINIRNEQWFKIKIMSIKNVFCFLNHSEK